MKTKELAKKLFVIALVTVLSFTAIFATAKYIQQTADEKNSKEDFIQIESAINSEITDETVSENTEKSEQELAYEKYQQLLSQNDDFIGWIKIEDSNVNYPVMHTVENPGYYLKHNFDGQYSDYGVPFLDERCAVDLTNNLVIYGHNMKNGTMFTDLVNYSDKDFWEEHQIINFDTMAEFSKYQVMYAFSFDTNNETFCYNDFTNMNEEQFAEFMSECEKRMAYDTGIKAEFGDEILTLSTCEYTHENGRFVVVAKKINDDPSVRMAEE